jgi:hypothetical protein
MGLGGTAAWVAWKTICFIFWIGFKKIRCRHMWVMRCFYLAGALGSAACKLLQLPPPLLQREPERAQVEQSSKV